MNIPRPEHPKPQFERAQWQNLNGCWDYEIDQSRSGIDRGLYQPDAVLHSKILVPFCPQSVLSGIAHKDFLYGVWYKRSFELTREQIEQCVYLHFGAVDYFCRVYVNGIAAGEHKGGYVSFKFDISELVHPGTNIVTVYAEDDERDPLIPRGKQCESYFSRRCDYTRTTGIWQTVWLEFAPKRHIRSVKITPNIQEGSLWLDADLCGDGCFCAQAWYEDRLVGQVNADVHTGRLQITLPLAEKHLWQPGEGHLYQLKFTYQDDAVHSYAGLREVALKNGKFLLNGKSVFLRTILDQGFYPNGIYTAATEEELIRDIELSMQCGFNGARLHEKIFEERFLYHCDRLGYLVFGEYPSWGLDVTRPEALFSVLPEWLEEINRDYNHPSIIGWCPFNETWDRNHRKQCDDVIRMTYLATKAADGTRPCIDTSGNYHVQTDIWDVHNYDQDVAVFRQCYDTFATGGELKDRVNETQIRQVYDGKSPVFVSEYGGIGWSLDKSAWGYGKVPESLEAFIQRFRGLTDALLDNPKIIGMCYTQMTDVEQEQNGLFTDQRIPKIPLDILHGILSRKAAIED